MAQILSEQLFVPQPEFDLLENPLFLKGLNSTFHKGLTEYEKFKILRPIIGDYELDEFDMPIIKNINQNNTDFEHLRPVVFNKLNRFEDKRNILSVTFCYDKVIESIWNKPLNRLHDFANCAAVATPDYSIYPKMNKNIVSFNTFRNRWLGVIWQNLGCNVFPTIGWCKPDTYDICFSGCQKGLPVVISTLGCKENLEVFFNGFSEMKKRLQPSIIIVIGDMIKGMTGKFVNFVFEDLFVSGKRQVRLNSLPQIFEIKEVSYGF